MGAAFQVFLKNTFDIREGEVRQAIRMQLNIFLIISTLLIVKPTVTGQFLSEIGVEQLPLAFLLVAVFAVLVSWVYTRFLGQVPLNRMILSTLLVSVLLFVFFGVLLTFNLGGSWGLYAFYIWVSIFGVLSASQFWILANVVFNAREAKRLFGFIGAGAIAGGIFGGYLTTILAEVIGSDQLPFLAAGMLFFCVPITTVVWKKEVLPTQNRFQRRKKILRGEQPLQLIRRSQHLTYLAAIIGISVIVARLVDYQFNAVASEKIQDPDELTAFLGFWFSNFNLLSLIIQLLLTRRIVGMLGVGNSLNFLPGFILAGAVLVLFVPELWAIIFIKMSDSSLKQSVNKAAVELLALPIPSEVKNQTKTYIDVVVDSVATGIGGAILIFIANGLDLSTGFISIMIVLLVGCWLYFIRKVRSSYLTSFKLSVQHVHNDGEKEVTLEHQSVIDDLKIVLETGSESQVLFILNKLKAQPDERMATTIAGLLQQQHPRVIEEAIRNLYFLKNTDYTEEIQDFAKHPDLGVKVATFCYLLSRSEDLTLKDIDPALRGPEPGTRAAIRISLAEESRDNLVLKEKFQLEKRLKKAFEEIPSFTEEPLKSTQKKALLQALGLAKMPSLFPLIESFFNDENPTVVQAAILAAGETMHPHFIGPVLDFLRQERFTTKAQLALKKFGPEIVSSMSKYTQREDRSTEILRVIPAVVEQFGRQEAADLLFQLLQDPDFKVRLNALRSLNQLKINHPSLYFHTKELLPYLLKEAHLYQDTLSILYAQRRSRRPPPDQAPEMEPIARQELIDLLEVRLDSNLERIFRLLELKYPPEDVIFIFESLHSTQPDLRANALEYLDNLLDSSLKKVLIPIVETALLDTISEEVARQLNLKIPDEQECYRLLLQRGDEELRRAVQRLQADG